jgi:glycosyltransferase involved in cell wall biosynthesis
VSLIDRVGQIIDKENIEIVQGVMLFATLIGFLASKKSSVRPPVIAAVHTTINRGMKQEIQERLLYSKILRRLPAVVFVCEHQRAHWTHKYPMLRTIATVVHNGVRLDHFRRESFEDAAPELRAKLGIPAEAVVFCCIAAFRPEKGHKLLIDAFSEVADDAFLLFAGDGNLRPAMEEYIQAKGLKGRTRFLGNVPDVRPVIVASDSSILASTAVETFSIAMLESMALGVPMIAPRIGGLPEAIIHGETGLLFDVGNSSELVECMRQIVTRPQEARRMGRFAEEKVTAEFTTAKMVEGSEAVLNFAGRSSSSAIGTLSD